MGVTGAAGDTPQGTPPQATDGQEATALETTGLETTGLETTGHETTGRHTDGQARPPEQNAGWSVFSYLISGMIFYGLAGWIASRLSHIAILFPVGMLIGLVLGIVLVIYRYGRA
jgi:ATP synthase protein I